MKQTKIAAGALVALVLSACGKPAEPNTVAIDNDAASPTTTEVLPPDEGDALNDQTADAENAATAAGNATDAAKGNTQ